MKEKNISTWFSILMTWFVLSSFCFGSSIILHIIDFIETGSLQYIAVFLLFPIIYLIVNIFVDGRIKFDDPDEYNPTYIDTGTYIESRAIHWANENSSNENEYILRFNEYENVANDLLRDIQWKNAWIERPIHHKDIMILDNTGNEIKIYKGTLSDVDKIDQPHFWMYVEDFKKYFIIKKYEDPDDLLDSKNS